MEILDLGYSLYSFKYKFKLVCNTDCLNGLEKFMPKQRRLNILTSDHL